MRPELPEVRRSPDACGPSVKIQGIGPRYSPRDIDLDITQLLGTCFLRTIIKRRYPDLHRMSADIDLDRPAVTL
jgi:hypothetical protein